METHNRSEVSLISRSLATAILLFSFFEANGQNASKLLIADTRYDTTHPSDYSRDLVANFKHYNIIGLPSTSAYYTVIGLHGWMDDSGGPSHELAFSNTNDLYVRTGFTSGWGAWQKILTDDHIRTLSNGNVLIGKTNQQNPAYKLDVGGSIRADKVVVNATGADYVFGATYRLMTLDSLCEFIKANHHLPGVRPAMEIQLEGLNVADAYTALLAKTEELTLYLVALNKRLNMKDKEIERLEKINSDLIDFRKRLDIVEQKEQIHENKLSSD